MIIDRLRLENFKRFKSEEIRFQDGITGILGNNGTGKSSIVTAIFFALYGIQGTGIAPDYLISSFASSRDPCSVRLDFRVGGEMYSVVRTLRKGKTIQHEANLHKGSLKLAIGVTQVDREIGKILGMGPVDFKNTIYAAQKDLLILLENTPGKRKEWFLRALGIDYLNTESQKILKMHVDARERELQLAEGEYKGMTERRDPQGLPLLEETLNSLKETQSALRIRQDEQITERKRITEELTRCHIERTEHVQLIERQRSLQKEIDDLVLQIDLVGKKLESLQSLDQEFPEIQKLLSSYPSKKAMLEALRNKKNEFERLSAEHRFADREIKQLQRQTEILEAKKSVLDRDAAIAVDLAQSIRSHTGFGSEISDAMLEQEVMSCHADIQHTISVLSERKDRLVTEWKKLIADWEVIKQEGPGGTCPLCGQTLGGHYSQIDQEFSARIETIQNTAMQVCQEQDRLVEERDSINQELVRTRELRNLMERLRARDDIYQEFADLDASLQKREREGQILSENIERLNFDAEKFSQIESEVSDLERKQQRYTDLSQRIGTRDVLKQQRSDLNERMSLKAREMADLKTRIAGSPFDPDEERRVEVLLTKIDTDIRNISSEIARNDERILHVQEKIVEVRKAEQQIIQLREHIENLKDDIELLGLTRSTIGEYVLYLMQVVRNRLEVEVSQIVSEITSGRYDQVLIDEDFNILIRDIDDDYPVDRFSGGEQDDIAVALRIALSKYLAELHQMQDSTLLIFDEIFGSQDEERRTHLLSTFRTQESRFPQILLISHISELQGEFSNALMVEMGSDLTSTVREVHDLG